MRAAPRCCAARAQRRPTKSSPPPEYCSLTLAFVMSRSSDPRWFTASAYTASTLPKGSICSLARARSSRRIAFCRPRPVVALHLGSSSPRFFSPSLSLSTSVGSRRGGWRVFRSR